MTSVSPPINAFHQLNNAELPLQKQSETNNFIQYLPDEVGEGHTLIVPLHEDFSFIDTNYLLNKNLAIISKIDDQEPRLVVTIALKGQSSFMGYQNQTIFFKEGYTTITIFNSSYGERQYQANKQIRQLRFSVKKSWIDKQLGAKRSAEIFANDGMHLLSHRPITMQGLIAARQLVEADQKQTLQHLFIQGHAMTLLAAELAALLQVDSQCLGGFTKKDKVIAQTAVDVDPPTNRVLFGDLDLEYNPLLEDTLTGRSGWVIMNNIGFRISGFDLFDVTSTLTDNNWLLTGALGLGQGFDHLGGITDSRVGTFNFQTTVVPLPTSIWLFVSGLMGLSATHFRIRRNSLKLKSDL